MTALTRRRFLKISAGLSATAALGGSTASQEAYVWEGTALGTHAQIVLRHPDREFAARVIRTCLDEVERLESVFSLYQTDSELNTLNRTGKLQHPTHDMRVLVHFSKWMGAMSEGAFDVSVQPLWEAMAVHFAQSPVATAAFEKRLKKLRERVDYRRIAIGAQGIRLPQGVRLTFNGVAQGYITDRVAELLHQHGWRDVLINLGEVRALEGQTWPVRLAPDGGQLDLSGAAVATSMGAATRFDAEGRWHHLLDPQTGRSARNDTTVSVQAPSAALADALSTALAVLPRTHGNYVARRFPRAYVHRHARSSLT